MAGNKKPRVIKKRELADLPIDTLVWVENNPDVCYDWKLDIECFQGISEHRYYTPDDMSEHVREYELCVDYMNDYDAVSDYGVSYRFWTARPSEEQMEAIPWQS